MHLIPQNVHSRFGRWSIECKCVCATRNAYRSNVAAANECPHAEAIECISIESETIARNANILNRPFAQIHFAGDSPASQPQMENEKQNRWNIIRFRCWKLEDVAKESHCHYHYYYSSFFLNDYVKSPAPRIFGCPTIITAHKPFAFLFAAQFFSFGFIARYSRVLLRIIKLLLSLLCLALWCPIVTPLFDYFYYLFFCKIHSLRSHLHFPFFLFFKWMYNVIRIAIMHSLQMFSIIYFSSSIPPHLIILLLI